MKNMIKNLIKQSDGCGVLYDWKDLGFTNDPERGPQLWPNGGGLWPTDPGGPRPLMDDTTF